MKTNSIVWGFFAAALVLSARSALAQLNDLKRYVRPSANALFVVDVEKVLDSPVAREADWRKFASKAYVEGVTLLPPDTTYAMLASELDLETMHPVWEQAIVRLSRAPVLENVARSTGGQMLEVAGRPAVELPGGAMAAVVDDRTVAAMGPISRQGFTRWRNETMREGGTELAPYLNTAFKFAAELGTPVIMAIDLENAFSADDAKALLSHDAKAIEAAGIKLDEAARLLGSIQGATLGVTLNKRPFAKVKVDFNTEVTASPQAVHLVFLHALEHLGSPIEEFHDFTPKVNGKQFTIEGDLQASGMRRLFSLFDRPPSIPVAGQQAVPEPDNQQSSNPTAQATKEYFSNLQTMLRDLRREPDRAGAVTPGLKGVWCRTYAQKIDRLPVLHVDPELLELSQKISASLYVAADNITVGMGRSRVRQTNVPRQYNTYTHNNVYGYGRVGGWYGPVVPYGTSTTWTVEDAAARMKMQTAISEEERIAAFQQARAALESSEKWLGEIRKKLTQKYNTEF